MWGISISTAVLQNELHGRLPQDFLTTLPGSVSTVYSLIPVIHTLPDDLKTSVRVAFADSVDRMWIVLAGIAGLGLISSLIMEGLPLHTQVDKNWGLEDKENQGIQEK